MTYIGDQAHQQPVDGSYPGLLTLQPDFGADDSGGGDTVDTAAAQEQLTKIQEETDRDGLRYFPIDHSRFSERRTKAEIIQAAFDTAAFAADIQKSLGIIHERSAIGLEALRPKVEPGPTPGPEPPPLLVTGLAGTYTGHGLAIDGYLGGEWGPHWGLPLLAPVDGRFEAYYFPTPLEALDDDPEYRQHYHELLDEWTCMSAALRAADLTVSPLQTMAVLVFWPNAPLRVEDQVLRWLGVGHVRGDTLRSGPARKGEWGGETWRSGIDFELAGIPEARADHGHFICGASTTLSPNGDVTGYYAIRAFGFPDPRRHAVPGPNDYQRRGSDGKCLYCAGRLRSDFQAAGRPIPPPPG